jgi:uncharacterized alkaline shock family protein YloU
MTNNTELQRVIFKNTITNKGLILEPVDVNVRLDLTLVIAYGNHINSSTGSILTDITEVFVESIVTPIYIRMSYSEFHNLIQAL